MDEPRRNDAIDRELRRAFAVGGGAAAGPHLDAEIAAAWMERRLEAPEQRAAEAHLADCHACQALLATLARISPAEAPVSGGLGWWRQLRAGWLVPATVAAAAALVIWVAVPQQRGGSTPVERPQTRDDRAAVAAPVTGAPEPSATAPAAPPAVAQEADAARRLAKPGVEFERKAANLEQAPAAAAPSLEARERFADAAPAPAPPAAAPPPAPAALSETIPVNPPQPSADKQRAGTVTVTGESPAPAPPPARQEVAAGAAARALDALASRATLARVNALVIVAADNSARWRRAGAAIEFAPRGDVPFTAASVPVTADAITAGAAPGGTVCWLAGRGGVVLVATDGLRFTQVTAPAPVDSIAVTATDARTATVTVAGGRRFRTTDQGATWTALP